MPRNHLRHRFSLGLSLVALMALVLMPMLTRAFNAPGSAQTWFEVCTAQGSRWVAVSPEGEAISADVAAAQSDSEPAPLKAAWEHCDYCTLQHSSPALPSSATTLQVPAIITHLVPTLFLQAPRRLHVWSSAQSRAPPLAA